VKPLADHGFSLKPEAVARLCAAFWDEYEENLFVSFDSDGEAWFYADPETDPATVEAFYAFVRGFVRGLP
jgi:hypothetical protein